MVVGLVFVVTYSIVILSIPKKKHEPVIEDRFENDDKDKQVVEYNRYEDGVKVGTVKLSYFTAEQVKEIEKIKAELENERRGTQGIH